MTQVVERNKAAIRVILDVVKFCPLDRSVESELRVP